jgi:poly-gamma-glutamate synthesis protein (capsule biosynthesis protein)
MQRRTFIQTLSALAAAPLSGLDFDGAPRLSSVAAASVKSMSFDWTSGSWAADGAPSARTARITVAADWAPIRVYEPIIKQNPLAVYGDLLPLFRDSDLNLVNVEAVLGEVGTPIPKAGPHLRGAATAVEALTRVPFQVACLANNHTLDYGPAGLKNTIEVLQKAGLKTVGAGMTGEEAAKPLLTQVNGTRVGILNCSEGEACCSINNSPGAHGFDVLSLVRQVEELKRNADVVLVVFHGGREMAPVPPVYVVEGLRQLAAAGASAVIAHHPHVPQGIEIYNGVPILYCLGNFLFWQEKNLYFTHTGYLAHFDLAGGKLARLSLTPYRIGRTGLSLLKSEEKSQLYADLERVTNVITDRDALQKSWDAFVDTMGTAGIINSMQARLRELNEEPEVGAARLHNLFFTPAHRELYLNGLKRMSLGQIGDSPDWAKKLVSDWANRTLEPKPEVIP